MILIISGLQGAGKTTVIHELLQMIPSYRLSVSATTRPKRDNEHPNEYTFMTLEEFNEKEKSNYFLEVIEFNNNKYGTPKHELQENIILNVNPSSIDNFIHLLKGYNYKTIFLNVSKEVIINRLHLRDKGQNLEEKLYKSEEEIKHMYKFEHIIENNNINETLQKILEIINQ